MRYSKYSGRGNFFSLPNELFQLGLDYGELAVYSFLKRCENRKNPDRGGNDRYTRRRNPSLYRRCIRNKTLPRKEKRTPFR